MTVITIPTIEAGGFTLTLDRDDREFVLMDKSQVIVTGTNARWLASFPLTPQEQTEGREWYAALIQLSLLENTFTFTPPGTIPLSGYGGADPVSNGSTSAGATSIVCDGVSNSTLIVSTGDYVEINSEFKMATADATSDGAGNVTIAFEPALRSSVSNNTTLDIQTPELTMRLADPRVVMGIRPAQIYGFRVEAAEAF